MFPFQILSLNLDNVFKRQENQKSNLSGSELISGHTYTIQHLIVYLRPGYNSVHSVPASRLQLSSCFGPMEGIPFSCQPTSITLTLATGG